LSKTSKRAILTIIVIATLLTVMIPIIPVMAEDVPEDWTLVADTSCTAEWSTVQAYTGVKSVHLVTGGVQGSEARIVIPMSSGFTLGDLDTLSWWTYLVTGSTAHVDVYIDIDDDGDYDGADDALVIQYAYNDWSHFDPYVGPSMGALTGAWYKTFSDDGEGPAVIDDDAIGWATKGAAGPPYWNNGTLAEWKAGITYIALDAGTGNPVQLEKTINASCRVLKLEIEVDNWGDESDAYIDDICINGVTYYLETYVEGTDFSIDYVDPGDVDYGDVLVVKGSDVVGGSTVNLYWDLVTAANLLNSTTGLASGDFECTVKIPSAYYGNHYIWAKDLNTGISKRYELPIPVVPKIKLSPSSGLPKDTITVKGYGFDVDSKIDITFDLALSDDGGLDVDETDDLGYFEYTFKVEDLAPFETYDVYAEDADGNSATAEFTVGAALTIDKKVGPAGTIVKVEFRGFTPSTVINTEVDIFLDGVPVSTRDGKNVTASTTGTGTVYVVIPSVSTGDYKIKIDDGLGNDAKASFEVDGETSIKVTPEYGTPGMVLTVKGYNFTQVTGTEVKLKLGERTATAKTDSSGSFTASIVIPPSDLGKKYAVIANDTRLCHAEDDVLVTIIFLQLSDMSAPVGSSVTLMGSGFTDGVDDGQWNATFGDLDLIVTTDIVDGQTYFSDTFHVPSLPSNTYQIGVYDVVREITVFIPFTITEQAALSVNRVEIPNGYNLTLKGVNFAEYVEPEPTFETTWWIFNSTDSWDLNEEPNVTTGKFPGGVVPVTSIEEDEEGTLTGYYIIPDFLELGSYTINCTTVSNAPSGEEWVINQTAEVDIKIVPEEVVLNVGSPSYARGQTITFTIKATLQKDPFDLGIKDPEGAEVFNSSWGLEHWKTLGSWYYIPSNLQIDTNTDWLYTLPVDAVAGTWTYSFWDENKEYANGTFQVTQLTEIEQLQQAIGEIVSGIAGMGASNTELAALVADLQGASAEAVAAAAAAAAAAGDAQTAAEAAMAAISDVDDTAGDALVAANDAKDAADRAKDAADAGLQAALDAVNKAQESVDAANEARESADANRQQTSGLTGLVYGAIGASLIAALAAIVSLMQISRRIAG